METLCKGISQIISYVLVIAISLAAVSAVLIWGKPVLDSALESAMINEGISNMNILADSIREVASEGAGSLSTIQLNVGGGSYRIDNASSSVYFELALKSGAISPGVLIRQGDVQINVSGAYGAANLQLKIGYPMITIVGHGGEIGRGVNKMCIEKIGAMNNTSVVSVGRC